MEKVSEKKDLWGGKEEEWKVESFTTPGKIYTVRRQVDKFTCDCPAFKKSKKECKHTLKVQGKKPANDDYEMMTKSGIPLDIAVSGVQKEIRRGNVENAVFLVQDLVLAGFIRYAYRRLAIVAAEDCGADPMATMMVHACWENDVLSSQNFKNSKGNEGVCITQATVYLAKCKKNRLNDDLWCYLLERRKHGGKPVLGDYFLDQHTKAGRMKGRGEDYWFKEASKLENEEGKNPYREKMEILFYES